MNVVSLSYETGTMLSISDLGKENIYFDIDYSLNSVISLMSEPLNVDPLKIEPVAYNKQIILGNALNKKFVKDADEIAKKTDYLIIDLLDERFNLLKHKDSIELDSWVLKESNVPEIYNFTKVNRNEISFEKWKETCDKAIELFNTKFFGKVIIHELYLSEQYKQNGQLFEFPNINNIRRINSNLNKYYEYLKSNLKQAEIININENLYTDISLFNVMNPAKKNREYIDKFLLEIKELKNNNYKYKVAVVIPSYNVENYIKETIDSVLNQSLDSVQVIVVDDGSTDGTQDIIKEMAAEHENLIYEFIENTGSPSQPRNIGKSLANAEYIMFLDGDDYISNNACEVMYNYAKEQSADHVIGQMMSFVRDKFYPSSKNIPKYRQRYEYEQSIKGYKETHIRNNALLYLFPSSCGKLFKYELVKNIEFDKNIKYAEDLLFSIEAAFESTKTILIEDFVYYYRGRSASEEKSTTQQKTIKNLTDLNTVSSRINKIIEKKRFQISFKDEFDKRIQYYRVIDANQQLLSITKYEEQDQLQAIRLIHDSLIGEGFDKESIKIFSIINYLKLDLLVDKKYTELLTLIHLLEKVTLYDYLSKFPFKTIKKQGKYYFAFTFDKKDVLIDISQYFDSHKLVNRLVDIEFEKDKMILTGIAYFNNISITNRNDIKHVITLINRKTKKEYKITPVYNYNNKYSTSLFKYGHGGYKAVISFKDIEPGGYDFFIETSFLGFIKELPLGGLNNKFIFKSSNHFFKDNEGLYEVVPVVKSRSRFALNFKKVDKTFNYWKRKLAANIRKKQYSLRQIKNNKNLESSKKLKLYMGVLTEEISALFLKNKEIWLVGEKVGDTAIDTGYWFFKHVREKHPDKKVYYLIDKKSADYRNVKKLGNVIDFYSLKHIIYSMNAKYIFSSDNVNIMLPSSVKHLRKATRVFIQHGIILPGRVENVYHSSKDFTDYILASSEFETKIIQNHLGFNENEILNVGLPRFDTLKNKAKEKRIMLTFTWRKDILDVEQLYHSNYFHTLKSLLENQNLIHLLEKHNIRLDVCLHPRTSQLLEEGDLTVLKEMKTSKQIDILNFNKVNVRELIERSNMILTDYSSVSFDFLYLNKPIINYLFQNNTPISEQALQKVLPGYVTYSEEEVINAIEKVMVDGQPLKKVDKKFFIKYSDGQNCERLVRKIEKLQ